MKIISPDHTFDYKLAELVEGYTVGVELLCDDVVFDFQVDSIGVSSTAAPIDQVDGFVALIGRRALFEDEFGDKIHPRYSETTEAICLIDIETLIVY